MPPTQVHLELLDQSDLIIVMEIAQKDRIHCLHPNTMGRVVLLGYFDSVGPLEIADPCGGPIEEFRSSLEQISRCCDALVARIILTEYRFFRGHVAKAKQETA